MPAVSGHRCDESCVCPAHDTPLIYWPAGDDHACQDPDCGYAQGMRHLPGRYDFEVPAGPTTDAEFAALPVLNLADFHREHQ